MTASWKKVRVSHILQVLSAEALARRLPSGENLTEQTPFLCPAAVLAPQLPSDAGVSSQQPYVQHNITRARMYVTQLI